jgi:hypothetical protein
MTTAENAMAVVSFSEKMKIARELVDEGHRLLHVANRDLKTGRGLVRKSHQLLVDTESVFQTKRRLQAMGSTGLDGVPPASMASPARRQRSSR